MDQSIHDIIATLKNAESVLIVTHIFPDGDALGSQLALADVLESLGKRVFLFGEEKVSYIYEFLPRCREIHTTLPKLQDIDCVVALDCGDRFRLGKEMDKLLSVHPFILIDHHQGNLLFGDLNWVDANRASTGEMVFDLSRALGVDLSYQAAYCLYTAIVSDTGSFKYSSTTADTFHVAGELISRGVKPSEVAGNLFDNFSKERLHLMKEVLGTLTLFGENRIAVIHVTQDMFDKTGASKEDTETFINYPRSLGSVRVAVFVKETQNGEIAVSLRSKGDDCDVARIAAGFGGGGHRNAAGFRVREETIDGIRKKLLHELVPAVSS
ncbi:bifunctional oligoribonuclease/PAP phosphatase NrnA [Thermodesulfobacteriota bacterium]